ncbi:MAG: hypothetical protein AAB809_01625 [Patescibacteria group bacterium]
MVGDTVAASTVITVTVAVGAGLKVARSSRLATDTGMSTRRFTQEVRTAVGNPEGESTTP